MSRDIYLSADIGGTNANFSIVEFRQGKPSILLKGRESSSSADHFPDLVKNFLVKAKEQGYEPEKACFAVAGAVKDQRSELTNVDLIVDAKEIMDETGLKYALIVNDFIAVSYGSLVLQDDEYVLLKKGKPSRKGTRAVIGAGTGLGKNILVFSEAANDYVAYPSEGGHINFPFTDEEEIALSKYFKRKHKKGVILEDVLSGRGIENLYNALNNIKYKDAPKSLSAKEISDSRNSNECSKEAFDLFIKFYARGCRNFALDVLATGGLYIGGGIVAKNISAFGQSFIDEFIDNETFGRLLEDIPIYMIINYDISLIGAAYAIKEGNAVKW